MNNNFKIKHGYNSVIIEKDGTIFSVEKGLDGDIWFNSAKANIKLPISFYSINQEEWQSYVIFENLMKSIVGRYVLNGDNEYGILPNDFIDLESKTITWYSDCGKDNKLQLQFGEKEIIVSITGDDNISDKTYNNAIKVRIRTSGSSYECYYQEFERFFNELSSFSYQVESMSKREIPTYETKSTIQKKLSLFDKFKK
jgi:hypothetical protein